MKILVIGSGGREHALTWKLRESPHMEEIYCAPGNAGIAQEAECVPVDLASPGAMLELAQSLNVDLTVVGPEAPLVAGVVDEFERAGRFIVGPGKAAARLEGSKIFGKEFMARYNIPTARFYTADRFEDALRALDAFLFPMVIKADGLAAGKGVVVAPDRAHAEQVLDEFMRRKTLGPAGERVVLEECLTGEEMSFLVLTDGRALVTLAPAQDHKALEDGDRGPNTGGMGAYSDDSILPPELRAQILRAIVVPTLAGLAAEGIAYKGFLYFGLMLTDDGPMVLEYNVRLGDPETQPTLMRLRSDLVEWFGALKQGQLNHVDPHWTPNPAVTVVLSSSGYPGRPEVGKVISGYEAAEAMAGVKLFHGGTRVEDHHLLTSGGRVMGVTAVGEDLAAAIERAYAAVGKIRFEGMHYRRDIGGKGLKRLRASRPASGSTARRDIQTRQQGWPAPEGGFRG